MGFNYTRDEVMQMSMNSKARKLDEIERRLAVVEEELASDVRENVRGEWEEADGYSLSAWFGKADPVQIFVCSKCDEPALFDKNGNYVQSNFCPHCGAQMKEPQNSADEYDGMIGSNENDRMIDPPAKNFWFEGVIDENPGGAEYGQESEEH